MGAEAEGMSKNLAISRSWRKALYGYLALARISNSPTLVSNSLAGGALAGALWLEGKLGLIAIAMVLFYTAGMYLNDLMDYAVDCRERPERPLPAGIVSRRAALAVALTLFGCGSLLLWQVGLRPFLSGLVLIALIICYDTWHKSNPLSPLLMALCRLMVYLTAFLTFSVQSFSPLLIPGSLLVLYVIGLTYIAKAENKPSMTNVSIVVTLFLPTAYFTARQVQQVQWVTLPLLLCFTIWVAYSVSFAFRSSKRQVGRTVGQLIAGISLLDALVLATAGSPPGVLLALVAFGLTLSLQHYVRGT
jgi:4-hydroxybenzoate polyprenyltransferase